MLIESTRPRRTIESAMFEMLKQCMDRGRPPTGRPTNRLADTHDSRYRPAGLFPVLNHDRRPYAIGKSGRQPNFHTAKVACRGTSDLLIRSSIQNGW